MLLTAASLGILFMVQQPCPDMVAASIEIARRAYHKFKKNWIYPSYNLKQQRYKEVLGNQWKEELELAYMSWKDLAGIIKNRN